MSGKEFADAACCLRSPALVPSLTSDDTDENHPEIVRLRDVVLQQQQLIERLQRQLKRMEQDEAAGPILISP